MKRSTLVALAVAAAVAAAVLPVPVDAEDWTPVATTGQSVLIEADTRLAQIDPIFFQLFLPDQDMDVKLSTSVQIFPVDPTLLGVRRARKAQGRATFSCLTPNGQRSLGSRKVRADNNGNLAVTREVSADLNCDFYFVQWEFLKNLLVPAGTSIDSRLGAEIVDPQADPSCHELGTSCLQGDRFRVEIDWRDFGGASGSAFAFPRTDDSGLFFFFDPAATEFLVKVLEGCDFNNHYWVFAAATTNVEYELTVTDTQSGQIRSYSNPLGQAAPAVTDTQAFATCP